MKPLFVLILASLVTLFVIFFYSSNWNFSQAGRVGMSCMLLFTAIGHFAFRKGMREMLPPSIPFRSEIVFLSGMIELIAAFGILLPAFRHYAGWGLIAFFLLILPANIYAANHRVNYQKGDRSGSGPAYLWFRVPLQILFILWVYWSCVHFLG